MQPARKFNDGWRGRFYEVADSDGGIRLLPSVTNILGAIGKPALVNWAAKTERELVIEAAANLWEDAPRSVKMSRPAYIATLQERIGKTKAHQRELQKAGEIGSQTHALIEWNLRKELGQKVGPEPRLIDKALWAFMVWEDWRKSVTLRPQAIEQTVYSLEHGFAGTTDVLAMLTVDGVDCLTVLDWKTGKAVYKESLLQIAAYVRALIEMGHAHPPVLGAIVRLPKIDTDPEPEMRLITWEEQQSLFPVFLAVKELWQWMDEKAARSA